MSKTYNYTAQLTTTKGTFSVDSQFTVNDDAFVIGVLGSITDQHGTHGYGAVVVNNITSASGQYVTSNYVGGDNRPTNNTWNPTIYNTIVSDAIRIRVDGLANTVGYYEESNQVYRNSVCYLSGRSAGFADIITSDFPIVNVNAIRGNLGYTYIDDADFLQMFNTRKLPSALQTDWSITKVGTKNPLYKLRCNIPNFDNPDDDFYGYENTTQLICNLYDDEQVNKHQFIVPYGDIISFSQMDALSYCDYSTWEKIINKIQSLVGIAEMHCLCIAELTLNNGEIVRGDAFEFDILSDGSIRIEGGGEEESEDDFNEDDSSEDDTSDAFDDGDVPSVSGTNICNRTYAITPQILRLIGQSLWGGTFVDDIKSLNSSPLENVLSIKLLPVQITNHATDASEVKIGNVNMGQNAYIVNNNRVKEISASYHIAKNNTLPTFMNYAPFTNISLYLPYVGIVPIPTNQFMDTTLKIQTVYDVVTGFCEYTIFRNNDPMFVYDCNIGEDVPMSASNFGEIIKSYISAGAGAVLNLTSGNIGGAISSIASGLFTSEHMQSTGSPTPSTAVCGGLDFGLIIDRPKTQIPADFGKRVGWYCNKSYTLSQLRGKGFTVVDSPKLDFSAPSDIKSRISASLQEGVYL